MTEKTFRERLLERGVPERILNEYSDEELKQMEEEMVREGVEEEYVAKLLEFYDYLENFESYPRKRVGITLAEPVYELLQYFAKGIQTADGKEYPFSYFVEDALVWLLKNPSVFRKFLEETYMEEEGEGVSDGSEKTEVEES